jgi:hypothetical protein
VVHFGVGVFVQLANGGPCVLCPLFRPLLASLLPSLVLHLPSLILRTGTDTMHLVSPT